MVCLGAGAEGVFLGLWGSMMGWSCFSMFMGGMGMRDEGVLHLEGTGALARWRWGGVRWA